MLRSIINKASKIPACTSKSKVAFWRTLTTSSTRASSGNSYSNGFMSSKLFIILLANITAVTIVAINKDDALMDGVNIAAVKKDIMDAIDADSEKRDNGTSIGPTLVRLAW